MCEIVSVGVAFLLQLQLVGGGHFLRFRIDQIHLTTGYLLCGEPAPVSSHWGSSLTVVDLLVDYQL